MDETDGHILRRWISVGDVMVMVTSLVIVGISYGTLATRVDEIQDDLSYIRSQDITPGAERRISVLEASVVQQRQDAAETRRELRQQLDRIESKLDQHLTATNSAH